MRTTDEADQIAEVVLGMAVASFLLFFESKKI